SAPYYQHEKIGYNYRLSNICAGIGRGQMTVVEEHIAHHRHIHSLYRDAFEDVEGVELMEAPNSDYTPNYWLSTIVVDKQRYGADYREIIARLQSERIESRPLWKPLHLQPVFSTMPAYVDGTAERLFGRGICLPSGPCVGEADVQRVVDIIENCV
ncbi:MAG: DegT/DnrJ/EryC1/StrS family aminotransferase, partial [Rikenellaceae bacterium]